MLGRPVDENSPCRFFRQSPHQVDGTEAKPRVCGQTGLGQRFVLIPECRHDHSLDDFTVRGVGTMTFPKA